MEEKLIKRLMTLVKCGSCRQNYEVHDIGVIGHSEDIWFLRVLCSSCQSHCLVAAIINEDKMPEVVTDLTETELEEFAAGDMVGGDDVLNMHNFLEDFDGDFSRLFGQG